MDNKAKNTILIVDDSFANRTLMNTILGTEYHVIQAEDGEEALHKLQKTPGISLIMLDLLMPELDGFSVLEKVFADPELKDIPVIVVTGVTEVSDQIKAFDMGAVDVITKPFNQEVILPKIRSILKRLNKEKELAEKKIREISQIQKNELQRVSQINPVTGTLNKQTFIHLMEEKLRNNPGKQYDLLRLDIDHFKVFNDTYGIRTGDRLLRDVGDFLKSVNPQISICGHIRADHFALLTERGTYNPKELLSQLSDNILERRINFEFICRIGVYQIENNMMDGSIICDRALIALLSNKSNFSHRVSYYDETMRQNLVEEQELINDMETAVINKEFLLYVQPQFDYKTKKLSGAEALIRWNHPRRGILSPVEFVPLFESNGFICCIDEYVWEESCRLIREWTDKNLDFVPLSVNISRRDIYNVNLCKTFEDLIKKYNIPPEMLRLEITESAYMDDPLQLINTVQELQEKGFVVEMDDFGSGYSSLNSLKDVSVDVLKLDMKFLRSEGKTFKELTKEKGGIILNSIFSMAEGLTIPIIAEGVETEEQAEYLSSIGCSHMQGFFFKKPIPVSEYEKMLPKKK